MESPETSQPLSMVIDLAELFSAALRRKVVLIACLALGMAAGLVWHATASKKYTASISFVRNQATEEASPLGGLAPLSLLGMGAQSSDPPLLKFIDRYLVTREFISQLDTTPYQGKSLSRTLQPLDSAGSPDGFYGKMASRIKVVKETGLITVEVWDRDPALCVFLADLVFKRFQADFNTARSNAIQENLAFANDMVAKSRRDLSMASNNMRDFLERNRGLGTPSLEQSRNELLMKVKLAEERYLMSEKERGLLEIKEQRKEQSLVVIEKPYLPDSPTYPKRAMTLPISLMAGMFFGMVLVGFLERKAWINPARH